ncbi:MAG: hypothetical protein V3Q69_04410 [Burkholderia sp.]
MIPTPSPCPHAAIASSRSIYATTPMRSIGSRRSPATVSGRGWRHIASQRGGPRSPFVSDCKFLANPSKRTLAH